MAPRPYLLGALSAVMLLAGCGETRPPVPVARLAPVSGLLTVKPQLISDLKPVGATLTSRNLADARARISGILVSLDVREGDTVRPGQVIARVKDDRIALQTGAFDAQVNAAAAEAMRAQAELARTRSLFLQGIYARARMDQMEAQARAADANLAAARALRGASAELGAQGAVLAPAAGRVLVADVPVGSFVMAGQSLARVTAGALVVRIELPEGQARALKLGAKVLLQAEDLPGLASQGMISQIYPSVTAGQVTADITADGLSRGVIGQRVKALVAIGEREALVVPRRYVVNRYGIDYVRLVRPDRSVSEIPIQIRTGPTPEAVEVLSGLKPGDVLTSTGVEG